MKAASAIPTSNGHVQRNATSLAERLPQDLLRHLEKSLKKQWKRYCKELKRCQKDFSEEAVHESRVETRRLLAMIELLAGFFPAGRAKKVRRALKHHLDTFDDLRDTQVQLASVGKLRSAFRAARSFHEWLADREQRFARQTRRNIRRVKVGPLSKVIRVCRQQLEKTCRKEPPEKSIPALLDSVHCAFGRTLKLWALIDPRDTASIHCTRVAFKKFRYMVEALACSLPRGQTSLPTRLRQYQTLMGDIQDAEVLLQSYDKFLCQSSLAPQPARRFRDELLRRRQEFLDKFLPAADRVFEFWPVDLRSPGPTHAPPGAPGARGSRSTTPARKGRSKGAA